MLAEAAARAGKIELAAETYRKLGQEVRTPEGAYFRSRAEALEAQLKSGKQGGG